MCVRNDPESPELPVDRSNCTKLSFVLTFLLFCSPSFSLHSCYFSRSRPLRGDICRIYAAEMNLKNALCSMKTTPPLQAPRDAVKGTECVGVCTCSSRQREGKGASKIMCFPSAVDECNYSLFHDATLLADQCPLRCYYANPPGTISKRCRPGSS